MSNIRDNVVLITSLRLEHTRWCRPRPSTATKYAVRALSDGLRQETDRIRVTVISPGVTESEVAHSITDDESREGMRTYRAISIPARAVARSIAYAIEQPPTST